VLTELYSEKLKGRNNFRKDTEDGGCRFIRNVGNDVPYYSLFLRRKSRSKYTSLRQKGLTVVAVKITNKCF
jgi:hypothetical protein